MVQWRVFRRVPPETCVPNTLIQLEHNLWFEERTAESEPTLSSVDWKGWENHAFCSAHNEMPCAATVNVLLKTANGRNKRGSKPDCFRSVHTACCVHRQVLKQTQIKVLREEDKQNKTLEKGYQSFCCIFACWQVINIQKNAQWHNIIYKIHIFIVSGDLTMLNTKCTTDFSLLLGSKKYLTCRGRWCHCELLHDVLCHGGAGGTFLWQMSPH